MQLALIDLELTLECNKIEHTFEAMDEDGLIAASFQHLAGYYGDDELFE